MDASYVKLRELALSYNIPNSVLSSTFIRNASVSLVARNLLIISKNTYHFDPATAIFTMAEVQLVEQVNSIDQNQNISRLLARYNSQTTYYGESQWNFYDRSLPDEMWETLYRDVLLDFKEVRRLIDLDQSIEAAAYLSQPEIGYETGSTANDFRKKIGLQKWIALYNRGLEGWAEWRRFDTPVFNIARNKTIDDIPMRMPYPYNENNLNLSNYTVASNAIGGDLVSTKLFWDIY